MAIQLLRGLLVDDDPEDYQLIESLVSEITRSSVTLAWASDRNAMLEQLARESFDIVLMDFYLGEYTGIELIKELALSGSDIPVVPLSGAGSHEVDLEGMAAGAVDYLDKGKLSSATLERTIRYAVEQSRSHRREREAVDRYRSLIEHDPAAFFIAAVGDYARKSFVNPELASFLENDSADETRWLYRVPVEDQANVIEHVNLCDANGEPSSISYRLRKLDGSLIWVHEEAVLVRDSSGTPIHWHGFIQDITAQKQAEAEMRENEEDLRHSGAALERSNRALQEFAFVASHDLKAPLVSIEGLASMLREDLHDNPQGAGELYVDRIMVNAAKLRELLDDLLELSRVGRDESSNIDVDLRSVIGDVIHQQRQHLDDRAAQVVLIGFLPTVSANRVRLYQVFANLIDNAVQYTPTSRAPSIEISAEDRGHEWMISVCDNGDGIPFEGREKVFTMFQRMPRGKSLNPGGNGMGLAIVARIIESNGGRFWIASSDESGTTFCLTLPKVAAQ